MDKLVFISYSSKDKGAADRLCAMLEQRGIPCWIAPRDVRPGNPYPEELVDAIDQCPAIALILSDNANTSNHVHSEIERAFSKGKAIYPVRIRNVNPCKALELFVSSAHWTDVWAGPADGHIDKLARSIRRRVGDAAEEPAEAATTTGPRQARAEPGSVREAFRRMVERAWNDGVFSNDEHEFLLLRARELGIPADDAEDMIVTVGIAHARDDGAARKQNTARPHVISLTDRHRASSNRLAVKFFFVAAACLFIGASVGRYFEHEWIGILVAGVPAAVLSRRGYHYFSGRLVRVECPKCSKTTTLNTHKHSLRCSNCGTLDVRM